MSDQQNTFMFILRGGKFNRDLTPSESLQIIRKYQAWIESLRQGGHYKAGDPLQPEGKVLSQPNGSVVTDGPFVESKEAVGGYFLIYANDLDEATELARGCPIFERAGTVEVRPLQVVPQM
jgi:hypothetical protein